MDESIADIISSLHGIETAWTVADREWDDSAARYFEQQFVQPLFMEMPSLVKSMEDVAIVFQRAQRELD